MSVRYSGDTEIRLGFDPKGRVYRGTVVDPYLRFRGIIPMARGERDPSSPDAYDDAARRLVHFAERWAKRAGRRRFMVERRNGRVVVRRVFHAACPLEDL